MPGALTFPQETRRLLSLRHNVTMSPLLASGINLGATTTWCRLAAYDVARANAYSYSLSVPYCQHSQKRRVLSTHEEERQWKVMI